MAIPNIKRIANNSFGASSPKEIFGNLSLTNQYQVNFSGFNSLGLLTNYLLTYAGGVDIDFVMNNTGLLCSEASLPGTSLATSEVKDNFMGIPQEFAHTRLYSDIDFTFYVDKNYNTLKFFEGWVDFVASGSELNNPDGLLTAYYYRRIQYPDDYKCSTMSITKFERDYLRSGSKLNYLFVNAFPKLVTAVPVSYGTADILRVSVTFNYDRYIVNPKDGQFERQKLHDFNLNRNSETGIREASKMYQLESTGDSGSGDPSANGSGDPSVGGGGNPGGSDGGGGGGGNKPNNNNLVGTGPKNYGIGLNQRMMFQARNGMVYEVYRTDTGFDYYLKSTKDPARAERLFGGERVDTSNNRNSWLAADLEAAYKGGHLRTGYWDAKGAKNTRPSGAYGGGSDIRLKENIIKIGNSPSGIGIYEWNYKSAPNSRYQGVMAQEVMQIVPEAVYAEEDGFLSVYYDMIDVDMKLVSK